VAKINLICSNVVFKHEIADEKESLVERARIPSIRPKAPYIFCYPRADSFRINVSLSRTIKIDQTRYVELECLNGPGLIETAELKLKSASSGLRIHVANASRILGTTCISTKASPGLIVIRKLEPFSKTIIKIPFELDDLHREISIRVDVTSKSSGFEYTSIESIPVELPIDVNVHDLFKSGHIFSRFHIRSATEVPIRVTDINLEGTEEFEVKTPSSKPTPTIIHAKQPATFMYKIHPRQLDEDTNWKRKTQDKEGALALTVDYQCIDEDVQSQIIRKFELDLKSSSYYPLKRLLLKHLRDRLRYALSASSYSNYTLTDEIVVPSYEELSWSSLLPDLPAQLTEGLKAWLEDWHESNHVLMGSGIDNSQEDNNLDTIHQTTRQLIISVPLPRLHVHHCVSLDLKNDLNAIPVGHPLTATLKISHTRRWESPAAFASFTTESSHLEFMYDIDAPQDTWVIGGPRRGQFVADEDEVKEWTLILLPLKTGKLLLPLVDVRPSGSASEELTSETEFRGLGKTVLVVGNLKRTNVAMTGSEASLIGAEVLLK
jgi:trafficking protein particle complex subunit 10